MNNTIRLSIVIVTFNSEKYINECLESIFIQLNSRYKTKVVIIDNASTDSTVESIEKNIVDRKDVTFIKNNQNDGFAKSVNLGIKISGYNEYYLLINPDTICKKDCIHKLITSAFNNNAGICGGTTVDNRGQKNGCFFREPNLLVGIFDFTNLRKLDKKDRYHNYFYYKDLSRSMPNEFPVDVVTGGFMLINSKVIKKIGLFDERFFMYLEDVDYCIRAKKNGFKIIHTNKSEIMHVGGGSSNNIYGVLHSAWMISRKLYFLKHFSLLANMIIQPIFVIDDLVITLSKFRKYIFK